LDNGNRIVFPKSFKKTGKYCKDNNLERISMKHREIYLTDPEKLKTVLRYRVEEV